jgi:phosphoribosylanthranilate isomerase
MIVKVCGMRYGDNIKALEQLDIDWLGFIFYADSPRYVHNGGQAADIASCTKTKVGVFVNASPDDMLRSVAQLGLSYVQLHGSESPDCCRQLRNEGCGVIKALPVSSAADLRSTSAYESCVDYFLFDTKGSGYGGTGRRFDWTALKAYQGRVPFLLSGGIGLEHVPDLQAFTHPAIAGVDVNSRFEISPALKDSAMLEKFIISLRKI